MLLVEILQKRSHQAWFAGQPKEVVSTIDGVEFITILWHGETKTMFTSESENLSEVLQAVASFCENLAEGGGPSSYRMKFNLASGPRDYIRGEIEWTGF